MNHHSNGIPKDPIDADRDDAFADHVDAIMDADDLARDFIELNTDAATVAALDVSTIVAWPTWTSPV
jgi:hypothetical protein